MAFYARGFPKKIKNNNNNNNEKGQNIKQSRKAFEKSKYTMRTTGELGEFNRLREKQFLFFIYTLTLRYALFR